MVHSAVKIAPSEARKEKNQFKVKMNLKLGSKRKRVYPELTEGDQVKIMRKNGISEEAHGSHWLREAFTTARIEKRLGHKYYYVNGRPSPLLRHELLKV